MKCKRPKRSTSTKSPAEATRAGTTRVAATTITFRQLHSGSGSGNSSDSWENKIANVLTSIHEHTQNVRAVFRTFEFSIKIFTAHLYRDPSPFEVIHERTRSKQ